MFLLNFSQRLTGGQFFAKLFGFAFLSSFLTVAKLITPIASLIFVPLLFATVWQRSKSLKNGKVLAGIYTGLAIFMIVVPAITAVAMFANLLIVLILTFKDADVPVDSLTDEA